MKWLAITGTVFSLFLVVSCDAETPVTPKTAASKETMSISPGTVTPTPEMWFYEQAQRQHEDPRNAIREKAEYRAVQRQRRITAMRWFGLSNQRPTASVDPIHGDYSPHWTSGNAASPNRWSGPGAPSVVITTTPTSSSSH